jgi:hypothetical protein
LLIIYLILSLYTNKANDINFNTMENNVRYRLEYSILENAIAPKEIYYYGVPYPHRVMTFSCTIGNSQSCHYYFAVAY